MFKRKKLFVETHLGWFYVEVIFITFQKTNHQQKQNHHKMPYNNFI